MKKILFLLVLIAAPAVYAQDGSTVIHVSVQFSVCNTCTDAPSYGDMQSCDVEIQDRVTGNIVGDVKPPTSPFHTADMELQATDHVAWVIVVCDFDSKMQVYGTWYTLPNSVVLGDGFSYDVPIYARWAAQP